VRLIDFDQYQVLASRTMKNEDTQLQVILHCVMGMCGEAGELLDLVTSNSDAKELVGEIGDCAWYTANIITTLGASMDRLVADINEELECSGGPDMQENPINIILSSGLSLLDYVKKGVFYQKDMDKGVMLSHTSDYLGALLSFCRRYDLCLMVAAEANIRKLEKRYPGAIFDADKAINRDYVAESKAAGVVIK